MARRFEAEWRVQQQEANHAATAAAATATATATATAAAASAHSSPAAPADAAAAAASASTDTSSPGTTPATRPRVSILRVLVNAGILRPFMEAAPLKALYDCLIFVGPNMLHAIITFLGDKDAPLSHGLVYVLALFVSASIQTFALHQYVIMTSLSFV
jgi:hypothetical protein